MKIGIDLDNTIIDYSDSFLAAFKTFNIQYPKNLKNKEDLKKFILYEIKDVKLWHKLQGLAYGKFLKSHGKLYSGVNLFLKRCKFRNHEVDIVSHKTVNAHYQDKKIKLRDSAIIWLKNKKLVGNKNNYISKVYFEDTKKDKIIRINENNYDYFIDDLLKILNSKLLNKKLNKIHFIGSQFLKDSTNLTQFNNWSQIDKFINKKITTEDVRKIYEINFNQAPKIVKEISKGGNSNTFYIEGNNQKKLIKLYNNELGRNRQLREKLAYDFLKKNKINEVPKLLNCNEQDGYSIFKWIEGEEIKRNNINKDYIKQAAMFIIKLSSLSKNKKFNHIPNASAACFDINQIKSQISERIVSFKTQRKKNKKLDSFFKKKFIPVKNKIFRKVINKSLKFQNDQNFYTYKRILSPSDFGFHNSMIVKKRLIFFDFEYFGWDDPVKLISDFYFHPGSNLSRSQKDLWLQLMINHFGEIIKKRLFLFMPLYGILWSLIMLNIFKNYEISNKFNYKKNCKIQLHKSETNLLNIIGSFSNWIDDAI